MENDRARFITLLCQKIREEEGCWVVSPHEFRRWRDQHQLVAFSYDPTLLYDLTPWEGEYSFVLRSLRR